MRILILGGTAWLGRHIVDTALRRGHEVTCLARGVAGPHPDGARFVTADRDAPDAFDAVTQAWDLVVDLSRSLAQVRAAVAALGPHAAAFTFVSSCSAYVDDAVLGADEDAATHPDPEPDTPDADVPYGVAKAAGERTVLRAFGADRSTIFRAGLIAGPGDPSGRSVYWPLRFAEPSEPEGRVLVPDATQQPTAIIDVRDLAAWIVEAAEAGTRGTFNAASASVPLSEHLAAAQEVAGYTGETVAADTSWLQRQGVSPWAGPRSLPLWIDDPDYWGMNARDTSRARDAGLRIRPLAETLADTLAEARAAHSATSTDDSPRSSLRPTDGSAPLGDEPSDEPAPLGAGLTDNEERSLLAAWDADRANELAAGPATDHRA